MLIPDNSQNIADTLIKLKQKPIGVDQAGNTDWWGYFKSRENVSDQPKINDKDHEFKKNEERYNGFLNALNNNSQVNPQAKNESTAKNELIDNRQERFCFEPSKYQFSQPIFGQSRAEADLMFRQTMLGLN